MSETEQSNGGAFTNLGISPKLLAHLTALQFTTPTPIQAQAIPVANQGTDVIGIAQTGTGKTLAFALPMIEQISRTKRQGLIILPTRELAMQVDETLQKIGSPFGLRTALIIGGASMGRQRQAIKRNPHVIVATPGRIIDHLNEKNLRLSRVGILVLDEADRMLDMGFAPQIKAILEEVPRQRQTMLFSATMPQEIARMTSQYMHKPVRVEVAKPGIVAQKVVQELFVVDRGQKNRLLDTLLDTYTGTVLVFTRTKYGAKKVCRAVRAMDHTAAELHSNLSLSQRKRSLEGFKSGKTRVLVATDIAARGIDVTDIELVVNYDLPDSPDDYVHRVGRTGRAGKKGQAVSFVARDQEYLVRSIERLVRDRIPVSDLPELPAERPATHVPRDRGYAGHGQRRQQRGRGGRGSRQRQQHGARRARARIH